VTIERERGAGGVFIFVILLLAVLVVMAMYAVSRTSSNVNDRAQTVASLQAAAAALEQYASATGRLPCPADPTQDTGLASPTGASVNCDFPTNSVGGTLPWQTIGMRRDDSFDAWGWKISYRVYSNTTGALTQAGGASMVNCNSAQAYTTRQAVDANDLCPVAHTTVPSDFISGKGLTITDFGTTYNGASLTGGAAYVLISHGPTGYGAYTAAGIQAAGGSNPGSTEEKNNVKPSGPFTAMAWSNFDVAPDDNSHFDDVLFYRTVSDLATHANLAARDWNAAIGATIVAGEQFSSTRVGQVLGSTPSSDVGVATLNFGDLSVSAFNSGGATDIGFTSGSTAGIGAVGGGSSNLTSTGGEGLQFNMADSARQFSVTLASFTGSERAQLIFYSVNPATLVATNLLTAYKTACGFSSSASFTIDVGAFPYNLPAGETFNRVEIRPWPQAFSGFSSTFRVEEVRACASGVTCRTTIYNSGDQC